MKVHSSEVFNGVPEEWHRSLLPDIKRRAADLGKKVVVLDDDPTGTQTVHDIPVLTHWTREALAAELGNDYPAFYILTNSRSLPLDQAQRMNREIGEQLKEASADSGRDFVVVSRSDSTLRGHFPGELEALENALGREFDAWLVIPFFQEGGRLTADDIHYVAEGEWLIPAGSTEYARDPTFGYHESNLRNWIQEKTGGGIRAETVASISLQTLRNDGPGAVTRQLMHLGDSRACIVNALTYRDLEVFVLGLLEAEAAGKYFLYRTAASFVQVRAGISPVPLLTKEPFSPAGDAGALFVIGSYVPRTTAQLTALKEYGHLRTVELRADRLVHPETREAEIKSVVERAEQALVRSEDVAVYTSRELIVGGDQNESLSIGRTVSAGLVAVVQNLTKRPHYILANGGITSSDLATTGLSVRRAMVLGQILPGVPVWRLGEESRHPGLCYIVFPGNVGDSQALVTIHQKLNTSG